MAAVTTVDYDHADPGVGVYGLYNDFFGIVSRVGTEPAIYGLQYKVKVTFIHTSGENIKVITPISGSAVFNPLELVKDIIRAEYGGFIIHSAPFSYNKVQVEIGAIFSTSATTPPTFEGYITDDTFYVYNGYEKPPIVANYRNPNWYDTADIKLPKILKEVYVIATGDAEMLSFLSEINWLNEGVLPAVELITDYYNEGGNLLTQTVTDLTIIPEFTGIGYWNININPTTDFGDTYSISKIKYFAGETTIYSEEITLRYFDCNPKQDPYKVLWFNKYGGLEQLYFTMKNDEDIRIKKGKKISSDGVNYEATVFDDIKNINNPNLKEYGNTAERFRTLRTDYLNQDQVNALEELYKSPIVIIKDVADNEQAVLVQDTSYKIESVKDGLVKVEVRVQIANTEPIQRQ